MRSFILAIRDLAVIALYATVGFVLSVLVGLIVASLLITGNVDPLLHLINR